MKIKLIGFILSISITLLSANTILKTTLDNGMQIVVKENKLNE